MARQRLSEFSSKTLVFHALSLSYSGVSLTDMSQVHSIPEGQYVLKVDQGVKKRFLSGLVKVNIAKGDIESLLSDWMEKGYSTFLLEPYIPHESDEEQYLSLTRERDGIHLLYSKKGGVHIEEESEVIKHLITKEIPSLEGIDPQLLPTLVTLFNDAYLSFLEINPFVYKQSQFLPLDIACEVDTAASFFATSFWNEEDFALPFQKITEEEKHIKDLSEKSQASFSLTVLNKNGSIFLLMSGGGASLVIADEIAQSGKGEEIANYGEYSGNPTTEETYLYTKELLSLLFKSTAQNKRIIIGGGVANFTDIAKTFTGVIQALDEESEKLVKEKVKVYVRRGGPNQKKGLALMEQFLKDKNLYGAVSGPDMTISEIVKQAINV